MRHEFTIKPGKALPLGVTKISDGVQFAIFLPDKKRCFFKLYKKGENTPSYTVELTGAYRIGSVYSAVVSTKDGHIPAELLTNKYEYLYEADGEELIDPYAVGVSDRDRWGKRTYIEEDGTADEIELSPDILHPFVYGREPVKKKKTSARGRISLTDFDWGEEHPMRIPFSDLIIYQLHTRGFTKHPSSKVKKRGTFLGIEEKIPYLKDLGINALLLLPAYEFDEVQGDTVNYWGYGTENTYYFAPKASYASKPAKADIEYKTLIKDLHRNGIEILMDFYFVPGTNLTLMLDCLRYWVLEFHVDGFRVNTDVFPAISLVSDPILSGVKLLTSYWDSGMLEEAGVIHSENALAEYNEGFMNIARRFLKSDEGMVYSFFERLHYQPKDAHVINFMTHVNGFTMMDLVSYDIKHNESNGERNMDGTEFNYSWNCGVEGKSRKKTVSEQRLRQIRNAFVMLFTAQGTPMLLAGDEFGNSQDGNNNPYCHDDNTTWLNWTETVQSVRIREYVKKIIRFRIEHPVLHSETTLRGMDTISCGVPDISAHGIQTWRPDFSNYSRMLGVLLYGGYAEINREKDSGIKEFDDSIYIIYNMYWEEKVFDLPTLPDNKEWHVYLETYDESFYELPKRRKISAVKRKKKKNFSDRSNVLVPPRSIIIYVSR